MAKSRKRSEPCSNPLSAARRSQNHYELIWNKKTGVGYNLFASYYGQQPLGTVVVSSSDDGSIILSNPMPSYTNDKPSEGGMSRASKRRRQKLLKTVNVSIDGKNSTLSRSKVVEDTKPKCDDELTLNCNAVNNFGRNGSKFESLSNVLDKFGNISNYQFLQPFLEAISKPLPLTFRLRHNLLPDEHTWHTDRQRLINELKLFQNIIKPVSYDDSIYQALDPEVLSKPSLSKVSPELQSIVQSASSRGILARQELGSMLPVLGLYHGGYLKPNYHVWDTCASPGSKTLQALECVGGKGQIFATDIHSKRIQTLKDAIQRSGMPFTDRILVTQHDASQKLSYDASLTTKPHVILVDVPCSGDGTVRKDPSILPGWNPITARVLHPLQVKILVRALENVRIGGIVSYSTCSLNPLENEAVVQAALSQISQQQSQGGPISKNKVSSSKRSFSVELIPWPSIKGLTLRPGIKHWKVLDPYESNSRSILSLESNEDNHESETNLDVTFDEEDGTILWKNYSSYEDAMANNMSHCHPTLWPDPNMDSSAHNLSFCRRLWPQDQDTGGFFVAFFRKNRA
jgi:multisite-specific tRNA:(cytosine-C5)-methyltransferase